MSDAFGNIEVPTQNAAPTLQPSQGGGAFDQIATGPVPPPQSNDVFSNIPPPPPPEVPDSLLDSVIGPTTALGTLGHNLRRDIGDAVNSIRTGTAPTNPNILPPKSLGEAGKQILGSAPGFNILTGEAQTKPMMDLAKLAETSLGVTKQSNPMLTAALEFGSGLTSPSSIALIALTSGMGAAINPTSINIVNKIAAAGFSMQQVQSAFDHSKSAWKAFQDGNENECLYQLTHSVLAAGGAVPTAIEATTHNVVNPETGAVEAKSYIPGMEPMPLARKGGPTEKAVTATRSAIAKPLSALANMGEAELASRAATEAQVHASKMKADQAFSDAHDAGVVPDADFNNLKSARPETKAQYLSTKTQTDAFNKAAPENRVVTTADEDGSIVKNQISKALETGGSKLSDNKVLNATKNLDEARVGGYMAKAMSSSVVRTLESAGKGEVADTAIESAENHIFREAAASRGSDAYLENLRKGYEQLRKNGLMDMKTTDANGVSTPHPISEKLKGNADTVNDLLDLRDSVAELEKAYPKQNSYQKILGMMTGNGVLGKGARGLAYTILGTVLGHGTLGVGIGGIGAGKWILSQTPVVRFLTKTARSMADHIKPEEAAAPGEPVITPVPVEPATVPGHSKTEDGWEPTTEPFHPAALNEATDVFNFGNEPETFHPASAFDKIEGPIAQRANGEPAGPETGAFHPAVAAPGAEAGTANAEPVEAAKAALEEPRPDTVMQRVAEGEATAKNPPEIPKEPLKPNARGTPEEQDAFIKQFDKDHPEASDMSRQEKLATANVGAYKFKGHPRATEAEAKADAAKYPGGETAEIKYGAYKGRWSVRIPKDYVAPKVEATPPVEAKAAPVTSEDPLYDQAVEALKDNPEGDAKSLQRQFRIGSDRAEKLFNEIKTHNEVVNSLNPGVPSGIHELAHAFVADALGIGVGNMKKTSRGAQLSLNLSTVPVSPTGVSKVLTALTGRHAAHLTTLAAGPVSDEMMGNIGDNWNKGIIGSDLNKFQEVLKSLGIDEQYWTAMEQHHLNKASSLLKNVPNFLGKAEKFMNDKGTVNLSSSDIRDFLENHWKQ